MYSCIILAFYFKIVLNACLLVMDLALFFFFVRGILKYKIIYQISNTIISTYNYYGYCRYCASGSGW